MKKILFLLFLSCLPAWGQLRTNLLLVLDYPPESCSTSITFHYFSSSNLSVPVSNWVHEGQQPCMTGQTSYVWNVTVLPHSVWWTACASNVEGTAFFPSAAEVPPLLRSDILLRVR